MRVEVELNEGMLARLRQMAGESDSTVEALLQQMVEDLLEPEPAVYQMKVTLRGSKPPIWRRLQVAGNVTLAELHDILQAVMGWSDRHPHRFIVEETYYGVPHPLDMMRVLEERAVDESGVRLNEVADEGARFVYEYDLSQGWPHVLKVEKVLEPDPGRQVPVCLKGRRATPPEHMGSMRMYACFLETLEDREHPEYPGDPELLAVVGDDFDPAAFDLDEVNAALQAFR